MAHRSAPSPVTLRAEQEVRRLRDSIRELWGDVQILVNNAGIARAVSFRRHVG